MAKSLFFQRRGIEGMFWRCGACGRDSQAQNGAIVKVGCDIVAVLCEGCEPETKLALAAVAPKSFPEVDAMGSLVEDGGAAQAEAPCFTATPR